MRGESTPGEPATFHHGGGQQLVGAQDCPELALHRQTVGLYLRAAELEAKPAILPTGSQEVPDAKAAIVPAGSKAGRTSQCAPLADVIQRGLSIGLSAQRVYQDLVAGHAFTGGYDAVKRFVGRLGQKRDP